MAVPLSTLHPRILEFDAIVTKVNEDGSVVLDKSYFYATSGGQPNDLGKITKDGTEYSVTDVRKMQGQTAHFIEPAGLQEGDAVHCVIDKERRERLMRMHTAIHIVAAVIEKAEGTQITGGQVNTDKSRIDMNLEQFDQEKLKQYVAQANEIAQKSLPVKKQVTARDELEQDPSLVKLAKGFPEHIKEIHMVEIGGFDIQPCGGTHVDNTGEIGTIRFVKAKNMGKSNRRVYFTVEP